MEDGYFNGAKLKLVGFNKAKLENDSLDGAELEKAYFDGAELKLVGFSGAKLKGVSFERAELDKFTLNQLRLAYNAKVNQLTLSQLMKVFNRFD